MRAAAREPSFLAAVLDHVAGEPALIEAFAVHAARKPADVEAARLVLAGPAWERDTA